MIFGYTTKDESVRTLIHKVTLAQIAALMLNYPDQIAVILSDLIRRDVILSLASPDAFELPAAPFIFLIGDDPSPDPEDSVGPIGWDGASLAKVFARADQIVVNAANLDPVIYQTAKVLPGNVILIETQTHQVAHWLRAVKAATTETTRPRCTVFSPLQASGQPWPEGTPLHTIEAYDLEKI